MSGTARALVLTGGGTAGGAWMLGFIHGLREEGVNLGDADLLVGTSAGARVGARVAAGIIDQGVSMYRQSRVPEIEAPVALQDFAAAVMRVLAEAPDRREAARRIANFEPLGGALVNEDARRRMVAAHAAGPGGDWRSRPLTRNPVPASRSMPAQASPCLMRSRRVAHFPGSSLWSASTARATATAACIRLTAPISQPVTMS